jgi:hypothetical protein
MSEVEREGVREPPIHVEPEGVKPELRKSGHRWIDLTIALAAIVLSVISLVVAINNARTQEKMVAAATWPLLQFRTTNVSDGEPVIRLTVSNTGVGPALLGTVELSYQGRVVDNSALLLVGCCGWSREANAAVKAEGAGGYIVTNRLKNVIIAPGEQVDFSGVPAHCRQQRRLGPAGPGAVQADVRRLLLFGLRGMLALQSSNPGAPARTPMPRARAQGLRLRRSRPAGIAPRYAQCPSRPCPAPSAAPSSAPAPPATPPPSTPRARC